MPIMEVILHLPRADTGQGWGQGRRSDPGEWQDPTASPHGHHEDDDDETLLHAGKGLCSKCSLGSWLNTTIASLCILCMQPPNPARLFLKQGLHSGSLLLRFCKPSLLHWGDQATPTHNSCGPWKNLLVCKITLCKIAFPCCHIIWPYPASLGRPATVPLIRPTSAPSDGQKQAGSSSGAGTGCPASQVCKAKSCMRGFITRLGLICSMDQDGVSLVPTPRHKGRALARSSGAGSYQLSLIRASVERKRAFSERDTGTLATQHGQQALKVVAEIWWSRQKVLRADWNSD